MHQNIVDITYSSDGMKYLVKCDGMKGTTAFLVMHGTETPDDVIGFKQDNAKHLSTVKLPGMVRHGIVTLKMGYPNDLEFRKWIQDCLWNICEKPRRDIAVEMINTDKGAMQSEVNAVAGNYTWIFTNAYVLMYTAPKLILPVDTVKIVSIDLAYEKLVIPD